MCFIGTCLTLKAFHLNPDFAQIYGMALILHMNATHKKISKISSSLQGSEMLEWWSNLIRQDMLRGMYFWIFKIDFRARGRVARHSLTGNVGLRKPGFDSWRARPLFFLSINCRSWCVGYPEICPSPSCLQPLNPATESTFDLITAIFSECTGSAPGKGLFPDSMIHLGTHSFSSPTEPHRCLRRRWSWYELLDTDTKH